LGLVWSVVTTPPHNIIYATIGKYRKNGVDLRTTISEISELALIIEELALRSQT